MQNIEVIGQEVREVETIQNKQLVKNMIKIQKKMYLRKIFYQGNFDSIQFWKDGSWADVGSNYGGEQDGNDPIIGINRSRFYDVTHKDITEKIKEIEEFLNFWGKN